MTKETDVTEEPKTTDEKSVHGHTGPTTPAEDGARQSLKVSDEDAAKIAEQASREEDA